MLSRGGYGVCRDAAHRHYWIGFLVGALSGVLMALLFAALVLGLLSNQFATGLALSLFGAGLSAFIGLRLQADTLPHGHRWSADLARYPVDRSGAIRAALDCLRRAGAGGGRRVVSFSHACRTGLASGG